MKTYHPIFTTDNITTNERWKRVRNFIENWYDFEIPDFDIRDELIGIENEINVKLPKSIQSFFTLAKQLQSKEHTYSYNEQKKDKFSSIFRDCLDISFLEKHNALSLLIQAEQDTYWAIKKADFEEENPKVYSYYLNYDSNDFELYGNPYPSVTSFVLNHILLYLDNCSSFGINTQNVEPLRETLKANLKNYILYDGIELFEDENVIAFITESLFDENYFSLYLHLKDDREIESLPEVITDMIRNREQGWTSNRFNQFS